MPSEKILEKKKAFVAELAEQLKSSCMGVLVKYEGINVADDTKLRKELREAGVTYFVVKNTMLRLAAKSAELDGLDEVLEGTTALALSGTDYTIAAKILDKFASTSKTFEIKLGFVDGNAVSAADVSALAKLPPREILVAQVLGGLNAPITGFAGVLNANLRGLACVLNAIAEQKAS